MFAPMIDKTAFRSAALLLATLPFFLAAPLGDAAAQSKPAAKSEPKSETKRIGSFQKWDAYEHTDKGIKLCYLHAQPDKKEPAGAKRGEIYILVTHKPKEKIRNEVSIYFGYPLKENVPAQAVIGPTVIDMFTHQEAAWAADAATDNKLVEALRKGKTLVVKGESVRGTKTTDTYDLSGFTAALQAIDKACNIAGATS
jgi:invasion protein IalB